MGSDPWARAAPWALRNTVVLPWSARRPKAFILSRCVILPFPCFDRLIDNAQIMKFHRSYANEIYELLANELAFLAAARCASQGASRVMETLEELEGLGNYSYHVLRSWGACCTAMHNRKVPGWKPRAVHDDGSDLRVKQRNPHFQLALV